MYIYIYQTKIQDEFEKVKGEINTISGLKDVQRVVCGGCQDYKIIISVSAAEFEAFSKGGHGPEDKFIGALKLLENCFNVETQSYTLESMLQKI